MIEARVWRARPLSAPPGFIRPCEPALVDRPPVGEGWLHEIKHDGFRILARKQGERVQLWSRRAADFTDRFERIADAVRGFNADEALIDGEAVVFQDDGRSDFHALLTKHGWVEAAFMAFDLLRLNADDLRQHPLEKRRETLMRLIAKRRGDGILFSEALAEEGAVVFAKACELGLEGIVSKRAGKRAEPQLAEDQERKFRQDVIAMPRDGAVSLAEVREPTLTIVCAPYGRRCGPGV
jgi:bifunctional non-homologous end joining protein LigD